MASYEPVVLDADPDLIAELKTAMAPVEDVHEAWLVAKRSVWGEREKVGLGVVAHVGGRWRTRRQIAALREALGPFAQPPGPTRLTWGSYGNAPVPAEVRAVGERLR
jgi:hypothetical protein